MDAKKPVNQAEGDPITPAIVCGTCKVTIGATDNYCRQCGAPTARMPGLSSRSRSAWWESPVVVLTLLFVVLGPFALPLLWQSRRFNRPWKTALSILVVGITLFAFWQVWHTMNQLLAPLTHGF